MNEEIDGYRRTSVKSKDRAKIKTKVREFRARGENVKVYEEAGYYYIYLQKEKDSVNIKTGYTEDTSFD